MEYLSDAWVAAADEAVRVRAGSAPADPLVIDQHIEGLRSYRVTVARDGASVEPLDTDPPHPADAQFTQSAETARAVATGETDAHQAFLLGRIRFDGDIAMLIERRQSIEWLEETLRPVMANTTFA